MELWIGGARVVTPRGVIEDANVLVCGGTIQDVAAHGGPPAGAEVVEAGGRVLGPGLIDMHINGAFGVQFSEASEDAIVDAARKLANLGVTAFVPTLISRPAAEVLDALPRIAAAARRQEGARILGVHLEGPYLSSSRRGAHREECLRAPSLDEFREFVRRAQGLLRILTIAPELPGALELVREAAASGVLVSAGHTDATAREFTRAVDLGVRLVTHLYNAMRPFHHRDPGVIGAALVDDRVACEIIYDRRHVAPEAVRLALAAKSVQGLALVSDATLGMGAPDGIYRADGIEFVVAGGASRLSGPDGTLAGSVASLADAVAWFAADLGLPPTDLFALASTNPARLLGEPLGIVAPGRPADLVLLEDDATVSGVILRGQRWR